MTKRKLIPVLLAFAIFVCVGALVAHAQTDCVTNPGLSDCITNNKDSSSVNIKITNPFKGGDTIEQFFATVLQNVVLPIGGALAVLGFVYAGWLFVTAKGNQEQYKKARTVVLYMAIGTLLLLGASAILRVISGTITALQS